MIKIMSSCRKNSFMAVFFLLSSNVWSAHFTFNIPVNFSNLHDEITQLKASCLIMPQYGVQGVTARNFNTFSPVINRAINETIIVSASAQNPRDYKTYRCEIRLCAGNACQIMSYGNQNSIYEAKPDSNLSVRQSGNL